MLRTETNTTQMHDTVLAAAKRTLGRMKPLQADFEHGQWWITNTATGAQWSVNDAETQSGTKYFDFEQVTEGEDR